MKLINFRKTIWILYLILAFFLLLKNSYSYLDPDLGWHLKAGEEILKTKELPNIERHDFTLEGKEWVDHEWLVNIITFWLYDHLGYGAVNVFFTLIIILILILQAFFIGRYVFRDQSNTTGLPACLDMQGISGRPRPELNSGLAMTNLAADNLLLILLIPFQLLGLMASFPHWGVRMQEVAALGLLLLLIIIAHYTQKRALGKKTSVLFWLLPLFYLWASLHASFLIGLFILFFWLAIKIIENLLFKINFFYKTLKLDFKNKLKAKDLINFSFFSIASLTLTFLTPYGLKLYKFLNDYTNTFYFKRIEEWLPFHYYPIQYLQIIYAAIVSAILLVTIAYAFKKRGDENMKLDLWDFCLIILFIFLAFKSRRHFPLLFIVSLPLTIKFIYNFFSLKQRQFIICKKYLLFIKTYLIIGLGLTIISIALMIKPMSNPFSFFCQEYPCEAVKFLKENKNLINKPIFNSYNWGGYLIWVWPEKKLFIDGRLPQYEFAGHTLLEEYLEFFDKERVKNKLKKHNIEIVFLKYGEEKIKLNWIEKNIFMLNEKDFNNKENALKDYLDKTKDWQLIYQDELSLVYEKK